MEMFLAQDYLDASERILRLNLSPTQEREVCHVLLHCALKEKRHNPYYAYLAQFFVKRDRRFHVCPIFTLVVYRLNVHA